MNKKRILSGITSTGRLTLGNYLGALKNFVNLQDDYEMFVFIANLHGITIPIEKKVLQNNIKSVVALYFASGLNPEKANIFLQSDIAAHANLAWIFMCNTTIGELQRMTQFKDKSVKSSNGTDFIPTGILTYPALMAADILLYDADFVPVGADQKQHIELTRNIAERMNNKYGQIFKIPNFFTPPIGSRIMDLQDPTSKMSKSALSEKGVIFMLDSEAEIRRKIKTAITDSESIVKYDPDKKPGICNLMTIYAAITNKDFATIENEFKNKDYGFFKNAVADVVVNLLIPIQTRYNELYNSQLIIDYLNNGARAAMTIANKKLEIVKESIGLNYNQKIK